MIHEASTTDRARRYSQPRITSQQTRRSGSGFMMQAVRCTADEWKEALPCPERLVSAVMVRATQYGGSLGDYQYKCEPNLPLHKQEVSPEPSVFVIERNKVSTLHKTSTNKPQL